MSIFALLAVAVTLVNAAWSGRLVPSANDTAPTPYGLTRRWDKSATATDELWGNAVCRGEQFVAAFGSTDEEAGKIFKSAANPPTMQSQWQSDQQSDLAKWGWKEVDANDHAMCDYSDAFWNYDTSYDALGLNKKPKFSGFPKVPYHNGGDNICYELWHGDSNLNLRIPFVRQLYKVEGEEYSKTGAYHKACINHVGGVVTAQFRLSPLHGATRNWDHEPHKSELPALRSSADLLWGLWCRDNPNIKNIKYFWTQQVANPETASIIASALKMWGKEVTGWPGATFSMESDEGLALLGSPNAISFGYFLTSHKKELGNKRITKAQVFWGDEKRKGSDEHRHPEMLFYVEDVPEGSKKEPGGQQGNQQP
ncbi:uncharacterized protein N0V89_011338 [Didymosphaeria variabile]|uniref:Uncharacterized protein n=1 Tax=Didymosphaeria variabile TaxID=1932322 RepID=A0A9W8X9T8_9PLEO|nr:uncharacterized protein N0V89_011338 [Didymosphaeria variabile]KAJ4345209.1 hypothetical protein N0V89_011338 [Didymosphaeria variabile]